MKISKLFFVEMTDTFGGEANYSWVKRFMVKATTTRGAISKVTHETGSYAKKDRTASDNLTRYNVPGACICYFVSESEGEELNKYSNVMEL